MNILYFAHEGEEHATDAAHTISTHSAAFVAVTIATIVLLIVAVRFLSRTKTTEKEK